MRSTRVGDARASGSLNGSPPFDGSVLSKFDAGKFRLTSTPLALPRVPAARPSWICVLEDREGDGVGEPGSFEGRRQLGRSLPRPPARRREYRR